MWLRWAEFTNKTGARRCELLKSCCLFRWGRRRSSEGFHACCDAQTRSKTHSITEPGVAFDSIQVRVKISQTSRLSGWFGGRSLLGDNGFPPFYSIADSVKKWISSKLPASNEIDNAMPHPAPVFRSPTGRWRLQQQHAFKSLWFFILIYYYYYNNYYYVIIF